MITGGKAIMSVENVDHDRESGSLLHADSLLNKHYPPLYASGV